MITTKDQEELFALIANYLGKDITCVAIGGTAMMFLGYKTATKDIDLVFRSEKDRSAFVMAIGQLGYRERTLAGVYDGKVRRRGRPRMYTRGDERFDLFVKDVFGCGVDLAQEAIVERRDFLGKRALVIHILPKEDLILLKAVTGREKDHEDIETIVKGEKTVDWEVIIDKAIRQSKDNEWLLLDLEATLLKLKRITFIPSKHFERIYAAQAKR
jgi:hypothetical protein